MSSNNALGHYRSVGAYGAAAAGDRLQLILRMMEGALDRMATARGHMTRQETGPKGEAITRAIWLIDGLRASLDQEKGGEIAANLETLYEYMSLRLLEANMKDQPELLDEVSALLREIKVAWQQIAGNPPVQPAAGPAQATDAIG